MSDKTTGNTTDGGTSREPSGTQKMYGDFAPGLVHFTDDVLFMQLTPVTATAKAPEQVLRRRLCHPDQASGGPFTADRRPCPLRPRSTNQLALPRCRTDPARHRGHRPRRRARRHGHPHARRRHRLDPTGEEHWHGGTNTNSMCHIAMLEGTDNGDGTTWLEAVTDEQYAAAQGDKPNGSQPQAADPGNAQTSAQPV